jgi:hypothetical protein
MKSRFSHFDVVNETSRAMDEAISGGWRPRPAERRESQLSIHYRSSPLVHDDMPPDLADLAAPRAGDRGSRCDRADRDDLLHSSIE